ncbi:SWIB-domain-containing protein, partial [Tothia fuscella]
EALPAEVEASYSAIIDDILAKSDLTTISAKAIRKGLQTRVDYDLTPQKKPITALIMQRFDEFSADHASPPSPPPPAPTAKPHTITIGTNGHSASNKRSASPSDDELPSDAESQLSSLATPPPKKKHKKSRSVELSDAALAARLQAEENGRTGRATRGAANGKRKPVKKVKGERKKKKSKARVGSDDDSSAEGNGEKKEVKRTGGFHDEIKPEPNSEEPITLPITQLSRPQTVKKIWEYIKAHDLQDPNDKRQILCDDALRGVFKADKVHMFTMNKILGQNLYAVDE